MQFNFPKKCYEFKPNTELLKTCVKCYENTLKYVIYEIVVWICLDFLLPNFLDNTGK